MSTPASTPDEPSTTETIQNPSQNESVRARLPRRIETDPPAETPPPPPPPPAVVEPVPPPVESRGPRWGSGCLPAFWTIASIVSLSVNVILLAVLLSLWPLRGAAQELATGQASSLLGGLYHNFVKMDQATISTTIPVDANIPLNIVVPVQTTTRIYLAQPAVVQSPRVVMRTGGLTLDAPALVTLPAGTPLDVTLDFPLTVQNTIPVHLDVPVKIPLNQTELHEPFVGLKQVVEPWYCMVEPDTEVNGVRVCAPLANPNPTGTISP